LLEYFAGQGVFSWCFSGVEPFQCCLYFLPCKLYIVRGVNWLFRLPPDSYVMFFFAVLAVLWDEHM
jgi:hypothetical protein